MGLDFDVKIFCQNLRATKPPYECPVKNCGKIYKSFCGIQFHLYNFDHINPENNVVSPPKNSSGTNGRRGRGRWHHRQNKRSPSPPEFFKTQAREGLSYAESQKIVEFDIEGKLHRINIDDSLEVITVSDMDKPIIKDGEEMILKKVESLKSRKEISSNQSKLPEASFRILEEYDRPDALPRPTAYYRFIEKSAEELDEEIEYDMDEEDYAWLELINEKRKNENLAPVSQDTFELLMDRLEKESYFQSQTAGKDPTPSIDEDAVCCICMDGECQNSNVILFCDMCNLAVHQECYGVPYIPEGQWLCRRCLQSPSRAVDCALCPNKGGAFKQTDDNRWAHVVCALWVPEVCFANTVFLEPIDSIENIPPARWKLSCYICKQRGVGACIQCHKANCYTAFHVTCAQQGGLFMKIEPVREASASGTSISVKKTAYCDMHSPANSESIDDDGKVDSVKKAKAKAKSRLKMRKTRKILAEKRSAVPVVSIPTIPRDRLSKIIERVSVVKKNQFVQRLIGYWTLKRQSRNGVPLLRRLQSHYQAKKNDVQLNGDIWSTAIKEQLKYWHRLRQDLERARLLIELIGKREKLKREAVKIHQLALELELNPLRQLLKNTLNMLEEKDPNNIFAKPVDTREVPDYLDYIKHPMDFSTMRKKLNTHQYCTITSMENDFDLMINNCLTYNAKDTIFYRAAIKLRDQGGIILRQLKRHAEVIGYDNETGLHLSEKPQLQEEKADEELLKDLDSFLKSDTRHDMSLEDHLKELLNKMNVAVNIRHAGTRIKRTKQLKQEISKIRREISLKASGSGLTTRKREIERKNKKIADEKMSLATEEPIINGDSEMKDENISASRIATRTLSTTPNKSSSDSFNNELTQEVPDLTPVKQEVTKITVEENVNGKKLRVRRRGTTTRNRRRNRNRNRKILKLKRAQEKASSQTFSVEVKTPSKLVSGGQFKGQTRPPMETKLIKETGPTTTSNKSLNSANSSVASTLLPQVSSTSCDTARVTVLPGNRPHSPSSSSSCSSSTCSSLTSSLSTTSSSSTTPSLNRNVRSVAKPRGRRPSIVIRERQLSDRRKMRALKRTHSESNTVCSSKKKKHLLTPLTKPSTENTPEEVSHGSSGAPGSPTGVNRRTAILFAKNKVCARLKKPPTPSQHTQNKDFRKRSRSLSTDNVDDSVSRRCKYSSDCLPKQNDRFKVDACNSTVQGVSELTYEDSLVNMKKSKTHSASVAGDIIPLKPLDLVWAKCLGHPWYPALIINPKISRTGSFHNGVSIPVPPERVLALQKNCDQLTYLISFFDTKRTWQWLPRNKLEPLGRDPEFDKSKLLIAKKSSDRKAVKKAYKKAILHRYRVIGKSTALSRDSVPSNWLK